MNNQNLLMRIEQTWRSMLTTPGQDQWPCDIISGFCEEIATNIQWPTTRELLDFYEDLLDLVINNTDRENVKVILDEILTRRALQGDPER